MPAGMCPSEGCHYDPRCRMWFHMGKCQPSEWFPDPTDSFADAQKRADGKILVEETQQRSQCTGTASDQGKVMWMPPYRATTGDYQSSCTAPVYDPTTGDLIGVIGHDINIDALANAINAKDKEDQLSKNGYTYVLDLAGRMLIHKNYEKLETDSAQVQAQGLSAVTIEERQNWFLTADSLTGNCEDQTPEEIDANGFDCETAPWSAAEANIFAAGGASLDPEKSGEIVESILNKMTDPAEGSGLEEYWRNGEKWHMAWHKADPSLGYIVIATLPDSDIQEPGVRVSGLIQTGVIIAIVAFAVIGTVLILIQYWATSKAAQQITIPVQQLSDLCEAINNGDLERNVDDKATCEDVRKLKKSFKGMVIGLRFGSEEYREGRLDKAESCFKDALELYETLQEGGVESKRGIGISQNNLASVYVQMNNFSEAKKLYLASIDLAKEVADSIDDELRKQTAQRTYSDRIGNLALLYMAQERWDLAEESLLRALKIDQNIENFLGFAIKSGSLGQLYLKTGDSNRAEDCFDQCAKLLADEDIRKQEEDDAGVSSIEFAVAMQHSMLNQGDLAKTDRNFEKAREDYTNALESYKMIDKHVQRKALLGLQEIYQEDGHQNQIADSIGDVMFKFFKDRGNTKAGPKDIALVLDYSGSMSGGKHRASMKNLKQVYRDFCNEKDSLMLIHFSNSVMVDFSLMPKTGNEKLMERAFDNLDMPGGQTAFYDAVDEARRQLAKSTNAGHSQWIIALTDGDDNKSSMSKSTLIRNLEGSKLKGLFIIAVGRSINVHQIEDIPKAVGGDSMLVTAEDTSAIDEAFNKVKDLIGGQFRLETY